MNLYITADKVGGWTGGSSVTYNESEALKSLGPCEVWGREEVTPKGPPIAGGLHPSAYDEPWGYDIVAYEKLCRYSERWEEPIGVVHLYAGTFGNTVNRLKQDKVKVTYTAAAHDINISRREHEALGLPYNYPHLTVPELWNRYIGGYLAADIVICPSLHSKECMQSFGCKRVEVIPHGVNLPSKVGKPPKVFTCGYLGSFGCDKGLRYLLAAWKLLNYKDAILVLAEHDSTSAWAKSLVNTFGGGNIVLSGFQKDVADFYNSVSMVIQPSACLLPGSFVYSMRGQVPIEELTVGDSVLTNDGSYRNVIKPLKRRYSGELIGIKTTGMGSVSLPMTPAHRVLAISRGRSSREEYFKKKREAYETALRMRSEEGIGARKISRIVGVHPQVIEQWFRGSKPHDGHCGLLKSLKQSAMSDVPEWKSAGDIEKDDVVLFPRIKEEFRIEELPLPQKIKGVSSNGTKPLPPNIELNNENLQFFGYYIAEGCASSDGGGLIWCFHKKEIDYVNDVVSVLSMLGLKHRVRQSKQGKNSQTVSTDSCLLSSFLVENFGRGAWNKTIPTWALLLPKDQLIPLIRGAWRGDGTSWEIRVKRKSTSYSTVSKSLALQLFAALVKLGYMPKVNYTASNHEYSVALRGDGVKKFMKEVMLIDTDLPKNKRGERTYIDDDYYYMPVTGVSRIAYTGDVFNLEVDGNHCYCAPFVVHNSEGFGCEITEAMSYHRPVLCSTGAGAADLVPADCRFPACDADALAKKIDWARTTSEANKYDWRSIAEDYTWNTIKQKYIDVWRGLLA